METEKSKSVIDSEKRNQKIEEYIRRIGVIKKKFPELETAPKSIQEEYYALKSLIDSLRTSRREIWGQDISSDGCPIDKFVKEKYETALANYELYRKENEAYITPEDEQSFEFPKIDIDSLREEIQGMETTSDCRTMYAKLAELKQQSLPESTLAQLNILTKEIEQISASGKLVDEPSIPEDEQNGDEKNTPVLVDESKFAQIYENAKGKIKEVLSKAKEWIKGKIQGKDSANRDDDSRGN